MPKDQDILITEIRKVGDLEDIGAERSKAMKPMYRYRYSQKVEYVLEDGQVELGEMTASTKPKLQEKYDRMAANIADGMVKAMIREEGFIWFTTTYNLAGRKS